MLAAQMKRPVPPDFVARLAIGSATSASIPDVEELWSQFPSEIRSITPTFASFLKQDLPEDARREWNTTVDDMIKQIKQ